jgi:hypothetical protein
MFRRLRFPIEVMGVLVFMRSRRLFPLVALVAAAMLGITGTVFGHHSYAMYDETKTLHAFATIKEFYFGAPHSSVSLVLMGEDGTAQNLTLQGASPVTIMKQGFTPRDFRTGMKVEVTWHPLIGGQPGGSLMSLKLEDGRKYVDNAFGNPSDN